MLGAEDLDEFVERALLPRADPHSAKQGHARGADARCGAGPSTESAELGRGRSKLATTSQKALMARRYTTSSRFPASFRVCRTFWSRSAADPACRAPQRVPLPGGRAAIRVGQHGDPRPGGPHTGDDIQADYGQGTVAVLPSKVVATPYGSWIGVGIVLRDAIGNEWCTPTSVPSTSRSASMSRRVSSSGRWVVRAGATARTCTSSTTRAAAVPRTRTGSLGRLLATLRAFAARTSTGRLLP